MPTALDNVRRSAEHLRRPRPAARAEAQGKMDWGPSGRSIWLSRYLVLAERADHFFAFRALVASFHEEMIRVQRYSFPLLEWDLYAPHALILCALANEGHRLIVGQTPFNEIVKAFVRLSESPLVLFASLLARAHRPDVSVQAIEKRTPSLLAADSTSVLRR